MVLLTNKVPLTDKDGSVVGVLGIYNDITELKNIQNELFVAKKRADSIFTAINGGANFMMLALQYSTDEGSKIKGGDLGTFGYGQMVGEFNDFCFGKPAGSKGVVKTQFGYHVIEVESQKGNAPGAEAPEAHPS